MKVKKRFIVGFLIVLLIVVYYRNNILYKGSKILERFVEEETMYRDWNALKKRNPDIYAWLHVSGTQIDYPVVQSTDKEEGYYLNHDIDNEATIYGAIYTEPINKKDFTDSLTVVYGHNMRDGSMFGSLKNFEDAVFFQKHDKIIVYLDSEEVLTYQIVASYQYPDDHLLSVFNFNTMEDTAEYFKKIPSFVEENGGNYRERERLKEGMITLSTCTDNDSSRRYLVQGILIDWKKGR